MTGEFCGANLRVARHFHALTLEELAEQVGKTRQYLFKLETGASTPTESLAGDLAKALEVEPEFFLVPPLPPLPEEQVHFRRLLTTKVGIRQVALAKAQVTQLLVAYCDQKLKLPPVQFDEHVARSAENIEVAAEQTRRAWGLSTGPIANITRLAENAGAVVTTFQGVSREVDALSVPGSRPLVVINSDTKSPCRTRFDIGHEIGHFVLHQGQVTGDRVTESEANRFASALLMPRTTFIKEFPVTRSGRIRWAELSDLKLRWLTSKAAMVMRARSLGLIDDHGVKSAFIRLKNSGESIKEIEDDQIPFEVPEILVMAMDILKTRLSIDARQTAKDLRVQPSLVGKLLPVAQKQNQQIATVIDFPTAKFRRPGYRVGS